jgi:site-specific DNA-methyltransferase (adenine-specific)
MKISEIKTSLLIPYSRNAKKHPKDQIEKIAASIKQFGFRQPLVIDKENVVVIGHGRLEAAKVLKLETVPCHYADNLTKDEINALRLADNKLNESEWDIELVQMELDEISEELRPLTGFDSMDITKGEDDDFDTTPAVGEPKAKMGDVYALGEHRLMCGDSTKLEDVEKLMGGEKADMVFTDPPYGISHSGKGIEGVVQGNDFGEILGDGDVNIAKEAVRILLDMGVPSVIWGANYFPSVFEDGHGWIVWDKQREGDIWSGAEIAYSNIGVRVDIFRHQWHGMVKESEHGEKRIHPTQKPIALVNWCIERVGNPRIILDVFGGSGSTLVACEQTGRKCRMMELDPKYVDVIITRWEKLTGKKAELIS